MNDVEVGRFSGLLHKLLGIREGSPAPTLAPELFAMLPVSDYQPDWDWLQGIHRKMAQKANIAVAAQYGHIEFWNPVGSGVLCVMTAIMNTDTSAGHYLRSHNALILGLSTMGANLDSRGPRWADTNGQSSVLLVGRGTSGAVLGTPMGIPRLTQGVVYPLNIVLVPGTSLLVVRGVVNEAIDIQAWWYERAYEPSETR